MTVWAFNVLVTCLKGLLITKLYTNNLLTLFGWVYLIEKVISGLCYKHKTIVSDESNIISKWSSKLIDDTRFVIYNCIMFIKQATGLSFSFLVANASCLWDNRKELWLHTLADLDEKISRSVSPSTSTCSSSSTFRPEVSMWSWQKEDRVLSIRWPASPRGVSAVQKWDKPVSIFLIKTVNTNKNFYSQSTI